MYFFPLGIFPSNTFGTLEIKGKMRGGFFQAGWYATLFSMAMTIGGARQISTSSYIVCYNDLVSTKSMVTSYNLHVTYVVHLWCFKVKTSQFFIWHHSGILDLESDVDTRPSTQKKKKKKESDVNTWHFGVKNIKFIDVDCMICEYYW